YWEEPHSKWGNTDTWNHYFRKKIPNTTKQMSHNALSAELKVLIQKLKQGTRTSNKALVMQCDLKNTGKQSNSQKHPTIEELTFDPHIATLLLQYRRVLEEMKNHYVGQESQRGRHLSNMLKPAVNMSLLEPILMENQNKPIHHVVTILRNLITKEIVDDVSPGFKRWLERLWGVRTKEYYIIDTITALTAITSVIFYSSTPCRVEFETDGFSVHKDEMVVAAEAAFEYNRFLTAAYYLTEDEVNSSRLHIGLINGTTIHLEDDIASALKLVAYLRTIVCQDGISLKALLNKKKNIRNGTLLAALPRLPKRAVKSHPKSDIEFTPQSKRVRYVDVCLNNDTDIRYIGG
ncbi:41862_t:CDS:2, partial [Gigaspora margarita]